MTENSGDIESGRMALASILVTTIVYVSGGLFGTWLLGNYEWFVFLGVFASIELVTTVATDFIEILRGEQSEITDIVQILKRLGLTLSFWAILASIAVIILTFAIATAIMSIVYPTVPQSIAIIALVICSVGKVISQTMFP